ncbi:restriction endonuclease subunit S [Halomonas sp. SpR8]|uniref:restriction endonuclease subunit S n=1 Tax=Halomonas sp. SpR8 TaxID=3050463 RepID=UPI0027E58445|nr:restriction endonuclease subunit S [Halomonas sp. SpR8]MDQ7730515.1 restriction endonuclease subunit S [Halomonas sp. SpR8]
MADHKKPAEWLYLKFTEVLDIQGGTQPPKSQFIDEACVGYIRLLQIRDFGKKPVPTYIPDTPKLKKCKKNDLLIGRYGASLGRICTGMEGAYNVALAKVITPSFIDSRFLHGYLNSEHFQGALRLLSRSAQNGFNKSDLETFDFLLPPLAEQKVIADKLDTLLAQVENTKVRLERIPQILKRFRQSVLAAAVSGRLTAEWRSNSDSYIYPNAVDWKWPPIPGSWSVKHYSDLVESRLGKMLDKDKNRGIPTKYLGNINVRWFDFNLSEAQEILVSEAERTELTIRPGDVLICEGGEPGRCAIWDGRVNEKIVFQKAIHRARVSEFLIPEWLAFNLKHDADSLTLEQLFTGTTIKHLTGKALKKYPLRIPPIEEQTEIVRRVDQLFAHADHIEHQVNQALARVNNLTQSILAKAFRGELTEQWRKDNPELISGENSASALLERIKAERAAKTPAKRTRKKATT